MATEEITYRVDRRTSQPGEKPETWVVWSAPPSLEGAKYDENYLWGNAQPARIVEIRRTTTRTVIGVDAASLDILSREEI